MATYDYAIGNTTPKWNDVGTLIKIQQVMNSVDIIASDTTLTTNEEIAANDIIQCINVPAGFVLLGGGVDVGTAGTADEGVQCVREGSWDLVILDIRMPGKDGLEALGEMLAEQRDIRVIINSAYGTFKDNFMSWAAEDYVVKSSDLTELKSKVTEVLAR